MFDSFRLSDSNLCCDEPEEFCKCKEPVLSDEALQYWPKEELNEIYADEVCYEDCLHAGGLACPPMRTEILKTIRAERKGRKAKTKQIKVCDAFEPWREMNGYL